MTCVAACGHLTSAEAIGQEAKLPGGASCAPLGAEQPRSGEVVKALFDRGEGAEVMPGDGDVAEEAAASGRPEHVLEHAKWSLEPAERGAPVVVHSA